MSNDHTTGITEKQDEAEDELWLEEIIENSQKANKVFWLGVIAATIGFLATQAILWWQMFN